MIEKWKTGVGNRRGYAALLTDLSKALGCFPHDLIISKQAAHGFDISFLECIHSYLSNRK